MSRLGKTASLSKKEELLRQLSERLEKGVYAPGSFLPPERLLAEQFGVSRPTVRKALDPLLRSGLLVNHPGIGTRVAIPGQDGNTPRKSWRVIGLLLPDITNLFYSEVTEAIEYSALQRGYQLLLCNSRHELSIEEFQVRQLASRRVDGVILAHDPHQRSPASVAQLDRAGIPYVFLFSSPAETSCDSVVVDDRAGVDQVMRYLFSLGHRQIAFCRPVSGDAIHPREQQYLHCMAQNNCPVPPHFVVHYESLLDTACRTTLETLLQQTPRPTVLFAGNDRIALILLKHLAGLQIRVPQDISVVGFDNLRFTEHLPVPLTTVDQPKQEMGRRAVEMLLEKIEIGTRGQPRCEVYNPHLIIRDSCAMATAGQDQELAPVP